MKIPSGFIGSFQPPSVAELRRAREPQPRETGADGEPSGRSSADSAFAVRGESLRRRADAFEFSRVQRIDEPDAYSGPGRSAVSAYLSVARSSFPAAGGAELAGIDIIV
jgi:hypothetical protein